MGTIYVQITIIQGLGILSTMPYYAIEYNARFAKYMTKNIAYDLNPYMPTALNKGYLLPHS